MPFLLPPHLHNQSGQLRRVGFELEFAGVDPAESTAILQELFGGRVEEVNRFIHRLTGTRYGTFTVELDASLLKSQRYREFLTPLGLDFTKAGIGNDLEEILARAAVSFIPYEIVTPPLPITDLKGVEELRERLREKEALGTRASFIYAFGLHINPEIPAAEVETLLAILRSFLLLHDWIAHKSRLDFSRRLTPFINAFPELYARLVVDPGYKPDRRRFIDDYLDHNPTRNRPLDLLPLLAFLDEEKVMARAVEKHLLKPRPAFHYRMPNCLIDDPAWRIATEWNYWVEIEKLAADPEKINGLSREYLLDLDNPWRLLENWAAKVEQWLA